MAARNYHYHELFSSAVNYKAKVTKTETSIENPARIQYILGIVDLLFLDFLVLFFVI